MTALRIYYGETFDPVHNGHLAIAAAAHDAFHVPVRLMPTADPPHRPAPGAGADQRLEMLRIAVDGSEGLQVDVRELRRGGRSYSIDTLHGLRDEFGADAPLALLVGADSFAALSTWKQWQSLFGLAHFIIADREGSPLDAHLSEAVAVAASGRWTDVAQDLASAPSGRVYRLRQPLRVESATAIRHAIAVGEPWRERVPGAVADYIARQCLYGYHPGATAS